jgi:RNA polymerase primary sigma factor
MTENREYDSLDMESYVVYKAYMDSIKDLPRISKQEEKELSKVIQGSDNQEKIDEAVNTLVTANLLLVVKYALAYYKKVRGFEYDIALMDLIEEGNIGLIDAAKKYDSDKAGFSTYATWYIKRYMQRARSQNKFIRTPYNHETINNKIKEYEAKGVEITEDVLQEVADKYNINVSLVKHAIECGKINVRGFDSFSKTHSDGDEESYNLLDVYVPEDSESLEDLLIKEDSRNYLMEKISSLNRLEQEVIFVRFFGDVSVTCEEMGKLWGVSKQRINQVLLGALKKLRRNIERDRNKTEQ